MRCLLFISLFCVGINQPGFAQNVDSAIQQMVLKRYPTNEKQRAYAYKTEKVAYEFMATAEDAEVKEMAAGLYPGEYFKQKLTYEKELSAKNYMKTIQNSPLKIRAVRRYPNSYSLQKTMYDNEERREKEK